MAAGLSELVVANRDAYRERAIALYHDREQLLGLRRRLVPEPGSSNLFEMQKFTAALEALFQRMVDDALAGVRRPLTAA